jgi:N-acetylmuramic acid 6-phosphate etherase
MVDMQPTNNKLIARGTRMIADELAIEFDVAKLWFDRYQNVRVAVEAYRSNAGVLPPVATSE